jgi:hypothetical protein
MYSVLEQVLRPPHVVSTVAGSLLWKATLFVTHSCFDLAQSVANTQRRSVEVVAAMDWYWSGSVVQAETAWHTASDVRVAGVAVNVLVPSQVVTVAHARSS